GGFGWKNASTALTYSKKRFVSSTKMYLSASENKYVFKDTSDKQQPLKTQTHAAYTMLGVMQELKFIINNKQTLSLNAWLNANQRELPAFGSNQDSKTFQQDKAMRLTGSWSYSKNRFASILRSAFFNDKINYTDSLQALFSKSEARTFIAENENLIRWGRRNQLNLGVSYQNNSALTENYASRQHLSKVAVVAANRKAFKDYRLMVIVSARGEYFSNGRLPITGHVSAEYEMLKSLKLGANIARVYRQPTLNELYWLPGGNPKLSPEQGYTFEGTAAYKKQFGKMACLLSASAYSRKIDNWILWVPGAGGNPSPLNIQQVWSRGTETNTKISYTKNKFKTGLGIMSAYVLSTIASSSQENNGTTGRQLIYTPRYTINSNAWITYNKTGMAFYHQYTGYRFTSSDNSTWLPPYHLVSVRLTHSAEFNKALLSFYLACNNLFNSNYAVMAGRPMPLRSFEFGISIQTKNNLTKK
ncbi:MAG: TonB-dependent receptor, partial [Bacteroidia bacterium]|nr:TonB-dependent receptor [Bacteroidia bacterium]